MSKKSFVLVGSKPLKSLGSGREPDAFDPLSDLAVVCVSILAGYAYVEFPSSSTAHPSPYARIVSQPWIPDSLSGRVKFPVAVKSNFWHEVAVPVLKDPKWSLRKPGPKASLKAGKLVEIIRQVLVSTCLEKGLRF
jgi:hypothetical protein